MLGVFPFNHRGYHSDANRGHQRFDKTCRGVASKCTGLAFGGRPGKCGELHMPDDAPDYLSGEEHDYRTNTEVAVDIITAAAADVICV